MEGVDPTFDGHPVEQSFDEHNGNQAFGEHNGEQDFNEQNDQTYDEHDFDQGSVEGAVEQTFNEDTVNKGFDEGNTVFEGHDEDQGFDEGNTVFEGHDEDQAFDERNADQSLDSHNAEEIEPVAENLQPQEMLGHDESQVEGVGEKKWPGWPGENVFRMLVPAQKVGSIIGRKGEFIKKIVEEAKARIKILDGPPGMKERAVMVSAKEEPDSAYPPAVDGFMRVHKRLLDGLEDDPIHGPSAGGGKISTRLLVAATQAGSLIGKQGATVKTIQEESGCIIRVLGAEDLPPFALQDDRVVELVGGPSDVHKGVELIITHLRKFLVDRSVIQLFEIQMQVPNPHIDHGHRPQQSWGPPSGLPPNVGGGPGFGPSPHYMPPPRQVESYYPPAEVSLPMEKQPHQGISTYGREAAMGLHASSNAQPAPSMITQITQQMQIPLSYADAVIGTAGSSISYIRRASGATVTIQETRGVPNEMTVEIGGTASQVQTAQQLIQNFMAEAAAGSAQPQTGGSADQGYNPAYATHGSMYSSPAPNSGHSSQTGGYGSVYGSSYGYQ